MTPITKKILADILGFVVEARSLKLTPQGSPLTRNLKEENIRLQRLDIRES
jgi:hypothetical protein